MKDITYMFASDRGFSGSGYRMVSLVLYCRVSNITNLSCHGNEIWDKIGYNSAYIRDISEIFAYSRGFSGSGY